MNQPGPEAAATQPEASLPATLHPHLFPLAPPARTASHGKTLVGLLLGAASGAVFGALLATSGKRLLPEMDFPLWLAFFAGVVMGGWMQIVAHEAGHALAGRLAGLRLVAAGVGRWSWVRGSEGWQRVGASSPQGVGGYAGMLPPENGDASRIGYSLFTLGGVLANLALSALCLWAATRGVPPWVVALLLGMTLVGLIQAVINLWPWKTRTGWQTDGMQLLDLWRNPAAFQTDLAIQRTAALTLAGLRPRDWPDGTTAPITAPPTDTRGAMALLLRMAWADDRDDDAEMNRLATMGPAAHRLLPDGIGQSMAIAMAGHAATRLQDLPLLVAWRPLAEGAVLPTPAVLTWLDAEAARLQGDLPTARTASARARSEVPKLFDAVSRTQTLEALDKLDRQLGDVKLA